MPSPLKPVLAAVFMSVCLTTDLARASTATADRQVVDSDRRWLSLMLAGQRDLIQGDAAAAISRFKKAQDLIPENTPEDARITVTLRYLGDAYLAQSDLQSARSFFERESKLLRQVSEVEPGLVYDYYQLAKIQIKQRQFGAAVNALEAGLQIRQLFPSLHLPPTNQVVLLLCIAEWLTGDHLRSEKTLASNISRSKTEIKQETSDLMVGHAMIDDFATCLSLSPTDSLFELQREFDQAALKLAESSTAGGVRANLRIRSKIYGCLADNCLHTGESAKAKEFLHEYLQLTIKTTPRSKQDLLGVIARLNAAFEFDPIFLKAHDWILSQAHNMNMNARTELVLGAELALLRRFSSTNQPAKAEAVLKRIIALVRSERNPVKRAEQIGALEAGVILLAQSNMFAEANRLQRAIKTMSIVSPLLKKQTEVVIIYHTGRIQYANYAYLNALQYFRTAWQLNAALAPCDRSGEFDITWSYFCAALHTGNFALAHQLTTKLNQLLVPYKVEGKAPFLEVLGRIQTLFRSRGTKDSTELARLEPDLARAIEARQSTRLWPLIRLFQRYQDYYPDVPHAYQSAWYSRVASLCRERKMFEDAWKLMQQSWFEECKCADAGREFVRYSILVHWAEMLMEDPHANREEAERCIQKVEQILSIHPVIAKSAPQAVQNDLRRLKSMLRGLGNQRSGSNR